MWDICHPKPLRAEPKKNALQMFPLVKHGKGKGKKETTAFEVQSDGSRNVGPWLRLRGRVGIESARVLTQFHLILLHDAMAVRASRCAGRSLALAPLAPSFTTDIVAATDTDAPCALVATRSPGPARTPSDGQVVEAE